MGRKRKKRRSLGEAEKVRIPGSVQTVAHGSEAKISKVGKPGEVEGKTLSTAVMREELKPLPTQEPQPPQRIGAASGPETAQAEDHLVRVRRRAFLKTLLAVLGGGGVLSERLYYYKYGVAIVGSLWNRLKHITGYPTYDQELIEELFGDLRDYVAYAGGKLEAFGGVHPDNIAAAEQVSTIWPLRTLKKQGDLEICGEDAISFVEAENLVLAGGPMSNDLTREQFEYVGGAESLTHAAKFVRLDYHIFCNRTECRKYPTKRFLGRKLYVAPGYFLQGPGTKKFVPEKTSEGFLKEDYLTISRVPNVIGLRAPVDPRLRGRNVLSFQGVHGTAIRALRLLFTDNQLLRELITAVPKSRYFQAVLRVPIKHDAIGSVSKPEGKLQLIDVVEAQFY